MLNALTGFYNGGIRVAELLPGFLLNLIVLADDQLLRFDRSRRGLYRNYLNQRILVRSVRCLVRIR
jgi:hypothetical protein